MHGSDWLGEDPTGWIMQEKFDGVFVRWNGEELVTRGGVVLNAPLWFVRELPRVSIDCELYAGRGKRVSRLSNVTSWRQSSPNWKRCWLIGFDVPMNGPFSVRHEILCRFMGAPRTLHSVAGITHCWGTRDLLDELNLIKASHGEGLMIRDPKAKYKPGRVKTMLKVKRPIV